MSTNSIKFDGTFPKITIEYIDYNLIISTENNNIKISLNPIDEEIPFFYNYESKLEDLKKINKIFYVFDSLEEVKTFLNDFASKKENIKLIDNFKNENEEKIIIQINYTISTISKALNITLEKKIIDEKKMIKYLTKLLNFYKKDSFFIHTHNSKLITNISEIELIKTGIKNFESSKKMKLNLLYRASRDGDTTKAFHEKVDGISPTISLIKAKNNYIFGGFTDHAWDIKGGCIKTNNTFMFSFNKKKIYNGKNGGYIHCEEGHGPWFCGGSGVLGENFFTKDTSYEWELTKHKELFDGFTEEFELIGGDGVKNFKINEVEVFKVEYI